MHCVSLDMLCTHIIHIHVCTPHKHNFYLRCLYTVSLYLCSWQVGEVDVPLFSCLNTQDCKKLSHHTLIHCSVVFIHAVSESVFSSFCTAVDGNVDIRTVTVQKVGLIWRALFEQQCEACRCSKCIIQRWLYSVSAWVWICGAESERHTGTSNNVHL